MSNILTKADIQAYAPELDLSSYSDTTISGMISRAQQKAASFCSVKGFEAQDEVDETDDALIGADGELRIFVRRRPINSVSAISLVKGSFSTSLTLSQGSTNLYQIPYPNTQVIFPNSYFYLTGTYLAGGSSQLLTLKGARTQCKITYNGGYTTIPDDLKEAITLYFRDILSKRSNPNLVTSFSQGSYSESRSYDKYGRSPLVQEAEDILMNGGFVRVGVF